VLSIGVDWREVEVASGQRTVVRVPVEDAERSAGWVDFAVWPKCDVGQNTEYAIAGMVSGPLHLAAGDDDCRALGFGAFRLKPKRAACGVPRQGDGSGLGGCDRAGSLVWWLIRSR
jgi:hypothetical protein